MSLAAAAGRGPGAVWSPTHVQVTVLQARGLRAKGPGGTSDAYAVIQVGKEKYATSVSERSLGAPVWREEATFELPPLLSGEPAAAATLQLTVLHRALLGLDKFLGRAEVDLRELHRDQGRRKTQWFTLKSKPGKKEKDRGEIEVDIQFMRNNMTASMFDLSVKDKSRNPFGKLKDKIKGKNRDSASDTASAIVPSSLPSVDSDDESSLKDKKKKSKIKTLFSKSTLQKTPLSQSMSVLPTSKADKVLLRPGDFQSRWGDDDEDNEGESSAASDVLSHKRTASADPKQLNQNNFTLPRKDGLSFLGGLRSKNDLLSRSNVCINGNHVYMEQPEAKSEARDSSPSSSPSPQSSRKKHLFSSTENLAAQSWKESGEGGAVSSDKRPSESPATDALKSMSLPPNWPPGPGDTGESPVPSRLETSREAKETKKQEGKKSSLLSLVTGKKDLARASEGDSPPAVPRKEKEARPKEDGPRPVEVLVQRAEKDVTAVVSGRSPPMNPFEEVHIAEPEAGPESKSEPPQPVATVRAPHTKAVKPRPEVSPEPPPAAMPPSSPDSAICFSALASIAVPSHPETLCSGSPLPCPPLSSPLAAPVSTSTPVESWPPADQGQAGARPPSLLLPAEQQEDLTHTPSPAQWGSLSQGPLGAECDGLEGFLMAETRQTDPGRSASREDSEEPLPQRHEGRGPPCPGHHGHGPPPGEALVLGSGRAEAPRGADADVQREPRACVRRAGADGEEGPLPLPSRDSAARGGSEAQRKTKKRVSFSEQLCMEEDAEQWPGPQGEDPLEPTREGTAASNVPRAWSPEWSHAPETGRDKAGPASSVETPSPHSQKGPSEGGGSGEAGTEDRPLCLEGGDALLAQNQSKASDHEGALSDPLEALQSRVSASLDVSLPCIPEVASDDERVDPSEGDTAPWGVGTPSLGRAPASPERGAGPYGGAGGLVTTSGSPCDLGPTAPDASVSASPARPSALGIHEADPGMHSGPNKQSLGPGSGEEAKVLGSGRASRSPDSPVTSPAFSETFPATRSVPNSPHSGTPHFSTAESQTKATAEGKVERSSKRKPLLQAWVSPSEAHPVSAAPSAGSGAAQHRPHPVKPMNSTAAKVTNSSLGTATIISENLINEAMMKKYNPSDPAFAYAQLTHDELIQLVLKQKEAISKKEFQVRELEDYIDNLLVRVMEETPNILRVPAQVGKKAGKM